MTDAEVIAILTKQVLELRTEVNDLLENMQRIFLRLICIGGPFNDNKHKFTKEQLAYLHPILNYAQDWVPVERGKK